MQAIANLSVNSEFAKAVGENGGVGILSNLARSTNRLVAEEAAGGLNSLCVEEENKVIKWKPFYDILSLSLLTINNHKCFSGCHSWDWCYKSLSGPYFQMAIFW